MSLSSVGTSSRQVELSDLETAIKPRAIAQAREGSSALSAGQVKRQVTPDGA
jgi:hypothetical protein